MSARDDLWRERQRKVRAWIAEVRGVAVEPEQPRPRLLPGEIGPIVCPSEFRLLDPEGYERRFGAPLRDDRRGGPE